MMFWGNCIPLGGITMVSQELQWWTITTSEKLTPNGLHKLHQNHQKGTIWSLFRRAMSRTTARSSSSHNLTILVIHKIWLTRGDAQDTLWTKNTDIWGYSPYQVVSVNGCCSIQLQKLSPSIHPSMVYISVMFPQKSINPTPTPTVVKKQSHPAQKRPGGTDEDSFNGITLDVPGFVGIGPPWPPPWCCTFGGSVGTTPNEAVIRFEENKERRWDSGKSIYRLYSWWSSMLFMIRIYISTWYIMYV